MPPKTKKQKTGSGKSASAAPAQLQFIWLLKYECCGNGNGNPDDNNSRLYSTKEKAIAAFPKVMAVNSPWGEDWKNGLEGFGKEDDDDDYLGFECFADSVRASNGGGVLLTNENHNCGNETITISVERMQVDPPDPPAQQETTHDYHSEIFY
jgi:hypothetical protein|eukprot:scaffold859_cov191-Chaetoceros_neogracile.AAC.3